MAMTKKGFFAMKKNEILCLFFLTGFSSFTLGSEDFHLIRLAKTYQGAQNYCRETYTDLATVHNRTDMNSLIAFVSSTTARAWIGLEFGNVRRWHWSWPESPLDFLSWKAGEPQTRDRDGCAAMDQNGKWFDSDCGSKRSFVCRGYGEASDHIFVADTKSWRDAQKHCRSISSELVSINSVEENEAVLNVSVSPNVWIGLFKDPWRWSDGSNSSFRFWKPSQPNYLQDQDCVVAVFRDTGEWNDLKCSNKRHFVCRGARKLIPTTTYQTSAQETFTTLPMPTNMTTLANNASQEVTTTLHFTISTQQPNVSTEEETTATDLTTPNTTDFVYSTSSSEINNVTNVQATTDGISAVTTQAGTSAQNTTQHSNLTSTENSQSFPPGNLTLIQLNMTWIEAKRYCREYHIDLVYITNKDIQEKVAEKAENATSSHVWLGLRYTCNFDFWFWTTSTSGCYQNWAPGEGSVRKYDCGVTGAFEATGRQQWVGLPGTDKLNFICSTVLAECVEGQ